MKQPTGLRVSSFFLLGILFAILGITGDFIILADAQPFTCPAMNWASSGLGCYKIRTLVLQTTSCCGGCNFPASGYCTSCIPQNNLWWRTTAELWTNGVALNDATFVSKECGSERPSQPVSYNLQADTILTARQCQSVTSNVRTLFSTTGTPDCANTDTPTPALFLDPNAMFNPQRITIPAGNLPWNIQFTQCVYFLTGNGNNTVLFLGTSPNPCPVASFWGTPVSRKVVGVTSQPITAPFCQCDRGTCIEQSFNGVPTVGCLCDQGYTGTNCDQPIDYCKPTNNCNTTISDCSSQPNGTYICACKLGYTGTYPNCQKDVNAKCSDFNGLGCTTCLTTGTLLGLGCKWCDDVPVSLCVGPAEVATMCPANVSISTGKTNATCPTETTLTNQTNVNIVVSYVGDTPNYKIIPKDNCGNTRDDTYVLLAFQTLTEKDSNGSVIQAINFPTKGYTVSKDSYNAGFRGFLPGSGITIGINITTFPTAANISFAGNTFSLSPSSNKWSINLEGWNFFSKQDTLVITVGIYSPQSIGSFSIITQTRFSNYVQYLLTNDKFALNMELPTVVELDGLQANATPIFDVSTQTVSFYFPAFDSSLFYDPDFGAILDPNANGDRNGVCVDDSETDQTLLIILLSVLVPFALAVAGVFFLVLLAIALRHRIAALFAKAGLGGSVNFADDLNNDQL